MYITYEDYLDAGGSVNDEAAFAPLEVKARRMIDRRTQGRLKETTYDEIPEDVKLCMVDLIGLIDNSQNGPAVASYSNDGVSVSYEGVKSFDTQFAEMIEAMLPPELLYRGVE